MFASFTYLYTTFTGGLNDAINFGTGRAQLSGTSFAGIFLAIADIFSTAAAAAGVAAITFGGVMYALSFGDESRASRAKRIILFAVIGMIVAGLAQLGVLAACEISGLSNSTNPPPACTTASSFFTQQSVGSVLASIFTAIGNILLLMISAAASVAIVWGAILYITSGGDESRASRGKQAILYAVIGLIIAGSLGFFQTLVCTAIQQTDGFCESYHSPSAYAFNILRVGGVLTALVTALAAVAILYGAYLYVTSQGREDQASRAKQTMLYAALGLVIASIAGILVNVVLNVLSV